MAPEPAAIEQRARFDRIRYANCWEDADVLVSALQVKKGGAYCSIASAGDNALALLSHEPGLVLAVDINPAQLACVEIRKAAFQHLSYDQMLSFLGIMPADNRGAVYQRLRPELSASAQAFWDSQGKIIRTGIIHAGKFERYFGIFRQWVLPLIHGRATVERLLRLNGQAAQEEFYAAVWNNRRWRLLFKIFFSRALMGRLGRDPEFFAYVETDVARRIFSRAEYALTHLPADTNPYLEYILRGNFRQTLPLYLRREHFAAIRANLGKLVVFQGTVREALDAYAHIFFDGFNLSDIFEYMSMPQYAAELARIIAQAKPGARLVYWNMLARRKECPDAGARLRFCDAEAATLFKQDKAFFYRDLIIGEVV
ncbi:MAG: BtaA family protein [Candidatus Omnitrophica bacterium]|nr:BtaA family protein [Candidatus Omnitrophota bacterium]